MDGHLADNMNRAVKITFKEFGVPTKVLSDAGTNFISDTFRQFYRQLYIEQAITSSYHDQNSGR